MLLWYFRVFSEARKRQSPLLVIAWAKMHGKKLTKKVFRIFFLCVLHRWKKVWINMRMKNIYRLNFLCEMTPTEQQFTCSQCFFLFFLQLYELTSANGGFCNTFTTIKPINLRTFIRSIISASIIWLCALNRLTSGVNRKIEILKEISIWQHWLELN